MWDASCKVGLVMLKAVLKANQSALFPPHAFDWSFQYKTKVSLWVWFFQNQYGQRCQYFWFLTHPSVKKGDTVTCMPNVHSHAQLTNWQWFSMVCTLIDNDIHYHRGQNLLQTHAAQPGESAETFEHCDDEHHCLETMLNHCQFLFTTIMTSNKMILSVDASSIGKLANQIATLLLIMEKMFGKYSWHPVIKNSLISRACIYQWKLRKKSKFSLINVSSSWK